jgi:hypothetical protein
MSRLRSMFEIIIDFAFSWFQLTDLFTPWPRPDREHEFVGSRHGNGRAAPQTSLTQASSAQSGRSRWAGGVETAHSTRLF